MKRKREGKKGKVDMKATRGLKKTLELVSKFPPKPSKYRKPKEQVWSIAS